jgi:ankyrin repeat protein
LLTLTDHRSTSPATDKSHEESTNESTEQIKEAIVNDNLAAVERILDTSLDVLETVFDYTLPGDENIIKGLTPLMLAAALGRLEITKLLLEKGSDCFAITDEVVNLLSCGKQNAFFFAISRNKFEVAKVILQKGGTRLLESRNERGETPLIVAARNGTVNVIDFLIEKGADIKARMGDGKTATHVASAFGHFAVVEKIYKAGGTGILEDRGRLDETPLLVAAACGDIEIFRFLLDKGASTMAQDTGSHTALHYASRASSFDIVKLLLEKEPDLLDMRTKYAETALLLAAEKGDLKIVEFLLDKGADIMARDYSKNTALHIASRESYIDIAKVLIKKEPDLLDARNGNEDTALLIAAFCADLEVVKFLHGKGADIEAEDWTGNTPLLHASYSRDRSVIRYLSKAGADPSKTTKSGPNALHIACYHQDAEVVDILLESPANILKTIIAAKILRVPHYVMLSGETTFPSFLSC